MSTAVAADPPRSPALLELILGFLPRPRAAVRAHDLPAELRPLLELGREILGASDLRDLDARLSRSVMRLRDLQPLPPSTLPTGDRPVPSDDLPGDSAGARSLGLGVGKKLLRALILALQGTRAIVDQQELEQASWRALEVRPWSLHDGHVVPHVLVQSATTQARGVVAVGALVSAIDDGRRPEPWLANALADTAMEAAIEFVRLVVSAGYEVEGAPRSNLYDLNALFQEAREADAAFVASLEADVRAGRDGGAAFEDE